VLAAPDTEWVLHAASQDVELLTDRLQLESLPKLFDTQVAWALSSAEFSVSLSYLRYQLLGVRTGKSHQADDWRRRPLPPAQLAYAASDIEDLPALHRALVSRLATLGREHLIHAASADALRSPRDTAESLSLDSFRNAWQLDVHSQAALRFLVSWYNGLGPGERAVAPEVKTLLSIASRLPHSVDDLSRIKGVSRRFVASFGRPVVSELVRAAAEADGSSFVPIDPPPYATFDAIRLDGWLSLARAEISAELQLAPELAFPARVLKKLRRHILETGDRAAAAEQFEDWRRELLAEPWRRFAAR
jgi:ribonuclease D